MQNVLKSSILIILLALASVVATSLQGQELSLQNTHAERGYCVNEEENPFSLPLILLLSENYEIMLGCTHPSPDFKSYLVLFFLQRYNKNNTRLINTDRRNHYFHPYSTLGKTKYYVFALREIIV